VCVLSGTRLLIIADGCWVASACCAPRMSPRRCFLCALAVLSASIVVLAMSGGGAAAAPDTKSVLEVDKIIPDAWRVGLAVFAQRMASRRCFLTAIAVLALAILLVAICHRRLGVLASFLLRHVGVCAAADRCGVLLLCVASQGGFSQRCR